MAEKELNNFKLRVADVAIVSKIYSMTKINNCSANRAINILLKEGVSAIERTELINSKDIFSELKVLHKRTNSEFNALEKSIELLTKRNSLNSKLLATAINLLMAVLEAQSLNNPEEKRGLLHAASMKLERGLLEILPGVLGDENDEIKVSEDANG